MKTIDGWDYYSTTDDTKTLEKFINTKVRHGDSLSYAVTIYTGKLVSIDDDGFYVGNDDDGHDTYQFIGVKSNAIILTLKEIEVKLGLEPESLYLKEE